MVLTHLCTVLIKLNQTLKGNGKRAQWKSLSMRDFTATHTLAKSSATRDLILKAEFPAFIHVGLRLGIISQDLVGNATVVIGSGMVRF